MSALKSALIAAGIALLANNVCVLLLMGTGMTGQWYFVSALIQRAIQAKPGWFGLTVGYLAGFSQFFIPLWFLIWFYGKRKGTS